MPSITIKLTDAQKKMIDEHFRKGTLLEFEEETISDQLQTPQSAREVPVREPAFGDISFKNEIEAPAPQAFSDISEMDSSEAIPAFDILSTPTAPFVPLADPAPDFTATMDQDQVIPMDSVSTATPAGAITDEQLKAILAGVSKDVIERIVWEVVPDLAEAMIREAIRKIKEGV